MGPHIPRIRKQKARRRAENGPTITQPADSNATEILPADQAARKAEHARLKAEYRAAQPGMSSKKAKRLDKYIETKLKKDEAAELMRKLASRKVDTSLLRSSKELGVSKQSKRKALQDAIRRQKAGIATDAERALLYEKNVPSDEDGTGSEKDSEDDESVAKSKVLEVTSVTPTANGTSLASGLKRPLEMDAQGRPILVKRRRLGAEPQARESSVSSDLSDVFEGLSEVERSSSHSETQSEDKFSDDDDDQSDISGESDEDDEDLDENDTEDEEIGSGLFWSSRNRNLPKPRIKPRVRSDFKDWAEQQINAARDFAPSNQIDQIYEGTNMKAIKHEPRVEEAEPLPAELIVPERTIQRKVFSVEVERNSEIQENRLKLPIVAEESKIMDAIYNNPVVVVCGATGSGKTTQVPQFLYEAGFGNPESSNPGMIAVTQPRRVAAVTMAKRVGEELGNAQDKVAYQIRFDSTVSNKTAIKFMTDGILIREISKDFSLSKYSAIVVDEAHERSVNTDILIGMVSRIVDLRQKMHDSDNSIAPLKLIIMSATLMTNAFLDNPNLFKQGVPPLVESEGRQYPVVNHFSRRTQRDYVEEAHRKVVRGHKKLPAGSMLVFLCGQNEISDLARKLHRSLGILPKGASQNKMQLSASEVPIETEDLELSGRLDANNDDLDDSDDETDAEEDEQFEIEEKGTGTTKALILPLYSQLPTKEQLRVFEPPPPDTRLIILATNVAETSITIPGIRYVFDCGRSKEKHYNEMTGVQSFEIGWISKASAAQRAGRAGRTGPGHCYKLYSSAIYERDFEEHTDPEILRSPVESTILQLKSMDLQHVANFPFPTPPNRESVVLAEKLLHYLGALDSGGKITNVGRELSLYPLSPRYGKMIAIGHQHGCMYLTLALVSALSVAELFVPEAQVFEGRGTASSTDIKIEEDANEGLYDTVNEQLRRRYNKAHGTMSNLEPQCDAAKMLAALSAYIWAENEKQDLNAFCESTFLIPKAMKEAAALYRQLLHIVHSTRPGLVDPSKATLSIPSPKQITALKQIVAAGLIDRVAIRADLMADKLDEERKPRRAIDVPYLTLFVSSTDSVHNQAMNDKAVFVHPSSLLAKLSVKEMPSYVIYSHLQKGTGSSIGSQATVKTRMHPLTPISAAQLFGIAWSTPLVEFGKPVGKIESVPGDASKRMCWSVPTMIGERGGRSWPLPIVKMLQKKVLGAWECERILA